MQDTPIPSPLRQIKAIAGATFLETMQQPAVLLLMLAGVFAVVLVPVLQFHQFCEVGRLARDGGLSYTLLIGLLLAATAASSAISRECDGGTAAVALSRPLPRAVFLFGKFFGVLSLLVFFWIAMTSSTLLSERMSRLASDLNAFEDVPKDIVTGRLAMYSPFVALAVAGFLNYSRRTRFGTAAFNGVWIALVLSCAISCGYANAIDSSPGGMIFAWRIIPAAVLVFASLAVFAALATLLSTRLKPAATMAGCAAAFALGLSVDRLASISEAHGLHFPLWLIPNLQVFWRADDLASGGTIPASLLVSGLLYAAAWCGLALLVSNAFFRRRDIS